MSARILIIDDEIAITRLIGTILTNEGYQTCSAQTRQDAERLLEQQEYDVIFVDIMLDRKKAGWNYSGPQPHAHPPAG